MPPVATGKESPAIGVSDDSDSSLLSSADRARFAEEFGRPDPTANFSFQDLSFVVKTKTKGQDRFILQDISHTLHAGEVLAILGPSGSGKSTLLNTLTLEHTDAQAYGRITLNGQILSRDLFQRVCYYVPIEGAQFAYLTPRETLTYAASLQSPDGDNEKIDRRVQTLLQAMGLAGCADTKIGNEFFTGISGGQKKRLSVAVALLSSPQVLFLDEPTSGLDSAAALGVMNFLKSIAKLANIMIICTIHQPSSDIFHSFDSLIFLAKGRIAYCGKPENIGEFLKETGNELPNGANPAEFFVDKLNDDFISEQQVEQMLNSWQKYSKTHSHLTPASADISNAHSSSPKSSIPNSSLASFPSQLQTLLRRHGLLTIRDPILYVARTIMFIIMSFFFSIIYVNMRDRVQDQVQNRMFVILWYIGPFSSLAVACVWVTSLEYKTIKSEIKNGVLKPLAYVCANTILQIPAIVLMTFIGEVTAIYAVSNFQPANLVPFICMMACTYWVFECYAQMEAVNQKNPLMAIVMVLNFWFSCFVFSGVMINQSDVPWPFRAFMYVLPLKYSVESLSYLEFHGTSFSGTVPIINGTGANGVNFYCPNDLSGLQCYGATGDEALASLHYNWNTITDDNHVARDFGILIGIAVFFKLIFTFLVWRNGTRSTVPKPTPQQLQQQLDENKKQKTAHSNESNGKSKGGEIEEKKTSEEIVEVNVEAEAEAVKKRKALFRAIANRDLNTKFEFKDAFYTVKTKKGVKEIISGVSGSVKAGSVLAIMGPSGAGKTTLLNMLTMEYSTSGTGYGEVFLNGSPLNRDSFVAHCYYVPQYPTHSAFLTPRQTLSFTSRLCHPNDSVAEVAERVETLLAALGLTSCADTKIGNEFFSGISGGQKKRLAVGVALLRSPKVLFLDEPTTGLDSAAAGALMYLLKDLAEIGKLAIVCTIHQPSFSVFQQFDQVMLLAKGELAYYGPATRVIPYFSTLGFQMPATSSVPEFMLDLINDEFTSEKIVQSVLAAWRKQKDQKKLAAFLSSSNAEEKINGERHNHAGVGSRAELDADTEKPLVSMSKQQHNEAALETTSLRAFFLQAWVLLHRQGILVFRDPMLYVGRAIGFLASNLFFCIIYYAVRDREQTRVVPRVFADMWCIGTPASMALLVVFAQSREMLSLKNEVKNGILNPLSYVLANFLLQIIIMLCMVLIGYLFPFYTILSMNPDHLGETVAVITCMLLSYEAIAEAMAVQFDHFLVGMLQFMNTWFSSFLFAGVVVRASDVPWPFRIFVYISPLRWGLETLIYLDTVDNNFAGAIPVDRSNANSTAAAAAAYANGVGYYCPDVASAGCFGNSGHEVLSSLHSHFDSFDDVDHTGRNIAICIALFVFFKLQYMMLLKKKVSLVADGFQSSAELKAKAAEKFAQLPDAGTVAVAGDNDDSHSHSGFEKVDTPVGSNPSPILVAPAPGSMELTNAAIAAAAGGSSSAVPSARESLSMNEADTGSKVTIHL